MLSRRLLLAYAVLSLGLVAQASAQTRPRWTEEKAAKWRTQTGWLVGANFSPAYAINQLEMWQADTFDLQAIDRELGWAQDIGMNSMRVFLHHLLWEQDKEGLLQRMDQLLEVADKRQIKIMFVLFDSVWDPNPKLGKQREPKQGLHNSGWVQSPGAHDLTHRDRHALLEAYTKGVIRRFRNDPRVVVWDLWNEPDNHNENSYGRNGLKQEPPGKMEITADLLRKTFDWARSENPTQPLTSGLWVKNRALNPSRMIPIERIQLEQSDIISFHSYGDQAEMKEWVAAMKSYNRPVSCTEYMARPMQSTFDPILADLKAAGVDAYNWGFVQGKSNTIYPWDSWKKAYDQEPPRWFHDIFRTDGTPYDVKEVEYIKSVTGKK